MTQADILARLLSLYAEAEEALALADPDVPRAEALANEGDGLIAQLGEPEPALSTLAVAAFEACRRTTTALEQARERVQRASLNELRFGSANRVSGGVAVADARFIDRQQ